MLAPDNIREVGATPPAGWDVSPRVGLIATWKCTIGALYLVLIATRGDAAGPSFALQFPLAGQDGHGNPVNAYTAQISSVLDHSASPSGGFYCNGPDHQIRAYTGELANIRSGLSLNSNCGLFGYQDQSPSPFILNGLYDSPILYYDGHPGYDYGCSAHQPVVAAASGTLVIPPGDDINGGISSTANTFNTFKIIHSNGFETWYLHTRKTSLRFPPGTIVSAGTQVAECWNTGVGTAKCSTSTSTTCIADSDCPAGETCQPTENVHLHFEVRRSPGNVCSVSRTTSCQIDTDCSQGEVCLNGRIVDPYGWEWLENTDPIASSKKALAQADPLWTNVTKPKIQSVSLNGSTVTITGRDFAQGSLVTLWDFLGMFFVQKITPISITPDGTQITATLPNSAVSEPQKFVIKIKHPSGPRSNATKLPSSSGSSIIPLALIGQQAPGGGTFSSFATFYSMSNSGDTIFNACVTDGSQTTCPVFGFAAGQFRKVGAPGFPNVGPAKINNAGDMAFGDASTPGFTQGIYLLPASASTPVKIAAQGDQSPIPGSSINGTTYDSLTGPLAISDVGDVTFTASALDAAAQATTGPYLFLYSQATGAVTEVVGQNANAPLGGTFVVPAAISNRFTVDGDVVFLTGVSGGPGGFYRFARANQQFTKVVTVGDSALGGTITNLGSIGVNFVSGRKLVFVANLSGASAAQAVLVKDDVTSSGNARVIAYEGQATGTEFGGFFATTSNFPFWPVAGNPGVQVRFDGAVLFTSYVALTRGGVPINRGVIFLWTGRGFKKIVADGDQLPSGQRVRPSSFAMNDTGQIAFFAAEIQ